MVLLGGVRPLTPLGQQSEPQHADAGTGSGEPEPSAPPGIEAPLGTKLPRLTTNDPTAGWK